MWPWEHLAAAYLLYSWWSHARWRDAPTARAAVVVAVASQLPDLVDKPLGWWLGVLPGGRSLAHSLLTAAPAIALVGLVAWYLHANRAGVAFAIGYLSHLGGDVLYPLVTKGELRLGFLLWPLTSTDPGPVSSPIGHLGELVAAFVAFLATPLGGLYLVADLALLATALVAWWYDDTPGLGWLRRAVTPSPTESA